MITCSTETKKKQFSDHNKIKKIACLPQNLPNCIQCPFVISRHLNHRLDCHDKEGLVIDLAAKVYGKGHICIVEIVSNGKHVEKSPTTVAGPLGTLNRSVLFSGGAADGLVNRRQSRLLRYTPWLSHILLIHQRKPRSHAYDGYNR